MMCGFGSHGVDSNRAQITDSAKAILDRQRVKPLPVSMMLTPAEKKCDVLKCKGEIQCAAKRRTSVKTKAVKPDLGAVPKISRRCSAR
jgi:hypothetical protein